MSNLKHRGAELETRGDGERKRDEEAEERAGRQTGEARKMEGWRRKGERAEERNAPPIRRTEEEEKQRTQHCTQFINSANNSN